MFTKLRTVTAEDRRETCCSIPLKHFIATLHVAFILLSIAQFAILHQDAASFLALVGLIWWIVAFVGFAEENKIIMVIHVIIHFIASIFITIGFFLSTVIFLFLGFAVRDIENSLPEEMKNAKYLNLILVGIYLFSLVSIVLEYYYTWMCYQLVRIVDSKKSYPQMLLLA